LSSGLGDLVFDMKITEKQVKEKLKTVIDPELKVNIVDLGLVYKIQVTSNKKQETKIKILMTLTTPGCPLAGMFDALVKNGLKELPGIDVARDVEIELTFDPPWGPHLMKEELRVEFGFE